jgi:hypothetical protein
MNKNDVGRACSTHGDMSNIYNILVGESTGKRLLGRPRRRWEDNIKADLGEIRWSVWTGLI